MAVRVAIGSDHGGFPLKKTVVDFVKAQGFDVLDLGTNSEEACDYPDFAEAVGKAIIKGDAELGIVLCGSGVGVSVAANKIPGIRAGVCHDTFSARQCRQDDDVNVLCMGARVIGSELAKDVMKAFLDAKFSGAERHRRRLQKVLKIEQENLLQKTK